MEHTPLLLLHAPAGMLAFFIGVYIMLRRKGTKTHKMLGKIYMGLMMLASVTAFTLPAKSGPLLFDHFGLIHLISLVVIPAIIIGWKSVQPATRNINRHKWAMITVFVLGNLVAMQAAGVFEMMWVHVMDFASLFTNHTAGSHGTH